MFRRSVSEALGRNAIRIFLGGQAAASPARERLASEAWAGHLVDETGPQPSIAIGGRVNAGRRRLPGSLGLRPKMAGKRERLPGLCLSTVHMPALKRNGPVEPFRFHSGRSVPG